MTLLAVVLTAAAAATAQPPASTDVRALAAEMDRKLPRWMTSYGVPGLSIAVLRHGEVVWMKAYGLADRASGRAMGVDHVFRVESLSKSVTAWGVMRLVQQGNLDLDKPVSAYLKDRRLPSPALPRGVTTRRLLSHTAGLPLGDFTIRYPPQGPLPGLRDHLAGQMRPIHPPGSAFSYSNVGFNLLELLVEDASGMRFSRYMKQEILAPLGMEDASFDWSEAIQPRIPMAYDLAGEPVPLYVHPGRGSGGLFATVQDMARFLRAGMAAPYRSAHRVLAPAAIEELRTPQSEPTGLMGLVAHAYGMGVFLERLQDHRLGVWNGGQGTGWMAHFHSVPETGDGIVILTNSQRSWPLFARILGGWSAWAGVGPVRMARLAGLVRALEVLTGLLMLISLAQLLRMARQLATGQRAFAPLAGPGRARRLAPVLLAATLVGLLAWERSQDYLFLWSILPHAMGWLRLAVLASALALMATAACPRRHHLVHPR